MSKCLYCYQELEDLTMKMADAAHIRTVRHTLIRLADGELGYLTLRMDRGKKGTKISMLDMCQLTNRLTYSTSDWSISPATSAGWSPGSTASSLLMSSTLVCSMILSLTLLFAAGLYHGFLLK